MAEAVRLGIEGRRLKNGHRLEKGIQIIIENNKAWCISVDKKEYQVAVARKQVTSGKWEGSSFSLPPLTCNVLLSLSSKDDMWRVSFL